MQYCMMLLEECGHIVAKVQATVNVIEPGPISCLLGDMTRLLFCLCVKISPSFLKSNGF